MSSNVGLLANPWYYKKGIGLSLSMGKASPWPVMVQRSPGHLQEKRGF